MATKKTKNKVVVKAKGPAKRNINFAHIGEKKTKWILAVPGIIIIVLLAALFSKVAIYDRYSELSALNRERDDYATQQALLQAEIDSYGDVETEYAHYTYESFDYETELSLLDRNTILSIVNDEIMRNADIVSWTLTGNVLRLTLTGITLDEVSKLSNNLKELDEVSYCMISTAQTGESTESESDYYDLNVTAVMTIQLNQTWEGGF